MTDFILGSDALLAILAFIIVLIPAVIVHELGHFFAARAVGITVLEFGIGFPPRLGRLFMWNETEFTLNLIPLGGFVRPFGEDVIRAVEPKSADANPAETVSDSLVQDMKDGKVQASKDDDSYDPMYSERQILAERGVTNPVSVYDVKPLPRIFFMSAGAIMNFIFAIFVFVLIGLFGLPEEVGVRLGVANIGAEDGLIRSIGLQQEDWIIALNDAWIESTAAFRDALIAQEGEDVTFTLRRLQDDNSFETDYLTVSVTPEVVALWEQVGGYVRIVGVEEGSPAREAGLQVDDLIAAFNGRPVQDEFNPSETIQIWTQEAAGEEVTLDIYRAGEPLTVTVVPRLDPPSGHGRMGVQIQSQYTTPRDDLVFVLAAQMDYIPAPPGRALQYGFESTAEILDRIASFPARIAQGATQPGETRVVSVVGVSQLGGEILQESIKDNNFIVFMRYIALISIALGITNLLPIPALDGGRILFAVIELIRGKPIAPEREGFVHMVGFVLLLSLGVLLMINDVVNPVTNLLP